MTDTIDLATRRAVARDICRREGHGVDNLVDVTTRAEAEHTVHACNRGCGLTVVHLGRPCTLADLDAWAQRHYPGHRVWLSSGTFDLEPPSQ